MWYIHLVWHQCHLLILSDQQRRFFLDALMGISIPKGWTCLHLSSDSINVMGSQEQCLHGESLGECQESCGQEVGTAIRPGALFLHKSLEGQSMEASSDLKVESHSGFLPLSGPQSWTSYLQLSQWGCGLYSSDAYQNHRQPSSSVCRSLGPHPQYLLAFFLAGKQTEANTGIKWISLVFLCTISFIPGKAEPLNYYKP